MKQLLLILITWLTSLTLNGQSLEKHEWKERVLLIKTQDKDSQKYLDQLLEFNKANEAMKERKLVVYQIVGDSYHSTNYHREGRAEYGTISDSFSMALLDSEHPFEVILIGLDGRVKLRKTALLSQVELFALIDGMPMRRSEMRKKNKGF